MAIVCLTSASGSPGVTTTAVGMAFSWPRPVLLVEADPRERADEHQATAEDRAREPDAERAPGVRERHRVRDGRHGCR